MTTFKKYLGNRLKETGLMTLVFTLLSVIFTLFTVVEETDLINTKNDIYAEYNSETGIYILAVILGIFCTVIPILETAGFKNRRNLDTLYFLPMSRFKLALAHYISGFIQITVIYTASFAVAALYLINYAEYFKLAYLPLYYIVSLLLGLVMYSFFIFIFGKANTVVDGVIFCALWIYVINQGLVLVLTLLSEYICILFSDFYNAFYTPESEALYSLLVDIAETCDWWVPYIPINNCTMIFQSLIENRNENFIRQVEAIISESYMFAVWGAVGLASAYGYFQSFMHRKPESTGEISDSIFGYKLLIPIYGFICIAYADNEVTLKIMFWAMMVVGYAIYRRGIKFKKGDIVCLAIVGVLSLFPIEIGFISLMAFALVLGAPVVAAVLLGFGIHRLTKAKRENAETAKWWRFILFSALLLVLSVAAVVSSYVFQILH